MLSNLLFDDDDDDDKPRVPILGEPYGRCEACGRRDAAIHCKDCGIGSFCRDRCLEASRMAKKHFCSPDRLVDARPPTDELLDCIGGDALPVSNHVRSAYHFNRCANMKEEAALLGVYGTLIKKLSIDKFQLHEWMRAKEIHKNIVRAFNRHVKLVPPTYFYWVHKRRCIFAGEDTSETLNMEAFHDHFLRPDSDRSRKSDRADQRDERQEAKKLEDPDKSDRLDKLDKKLDKLLDKLDKLEKLD